MGTVVFILGRTGTGKSYSARNFRPDELGIVNAQSKILPLRNAREFVTVNTDNSDEIIKALKDFAKMFKSIMVDDFQYVMANEFMRRSTERGYDKFTEIARHAWDIVDAVRTLPDDIIVYILCHTDTDNEGIERLKTIGKLLDEKIYLEGMSTIVLKTAVSDGQYMFLTQNNGKDTVKSPAGMFEAYAIENDLKYVDEKIRNYYGLGEHLTDDEIKEIDRAAAKVDVIQDDKPTRRRGRKAETPENTPVNAPTTTEDNEPAPTPRRRRSIAETAETAPTTTEVEPPKRRRRNAPAPTPVDDIEQYNNNNVDLPFEIDTDDNLAEPAAVEQPRRRRRKAN